MRWPAALFAVLAGCSPPSQEKGQPNQVGNAPEAVAEAANEFLSRYPEASATYSEEAAIVDRYLVATKGWPKDRYRLTFNGREGKYLVFWATHLDDLERGYPGGGKSRALLFDPVTKKVVRELALQ